MSKSYRRDFFYFEAVLKKGGKMKTLKHRAITIVIALFTLTLVNGLYSVNGGRSSQSLFAAAQNDCGISDRDVSDYLTSKGFFVNAVYAADDRSCNRLAIVNERTTLLVLIDDSGIIGIVVVEDDSL